MDLPTTRCLISLPRSNFAEDYDGFCARLADAPDPEAAGWQAFADMLAAAAVYE